MDNYTCKLFKYKIVILSKTLILLLNYQGDQHHRDGKFSYCECPIIQVGRFLRGSSLHNYPQML